MNKKTSFNMFDILNYTFLLLFAITTFYPLWHMFSLSLSEYEEAIRGGFFLWPKGFSLQAYKSLVEGNYIWRPYLNTIFVTIFGTALSLTLTSMGAYAVIKDGLPGKRLIVFLVLFTMLFQGGMIPSYLLAKNLGLVNTLWALCLPGAVPAFNFFIMKNFFEAIPKEMEESAYMDGANPIVIFVKIILPLSTAVMATIALWVAVSQWNDFINAVIYITDNKKNTLALFIRSIIIGQEQMRETGEVMEISTEGFTAASIVLSIIPIICTYPYLQKYFVKGVMVGSVKG